MKLFIQIPCLNEEKTLPQVISSLPQKIAGVDEIYVIIIDDGSVDRTVAVAEQLQVNYIVKNGRTLGLARSFSRGLEACLFLGADIIVNTDGDNQYNGEDIPKLVKEIIDKKADIVIGCRDIDNHKEFSFLKRFLQKTGGYIVQRLIGIKIPDVTSGFRAISRHSAMSVFFMNSFSYTLEMLVQASRTGLKIEWVPIRVNPKARESRLFRSMGHFIFNQVKILFKVYLFYYPVRFFGGLTVLFFSLSVLLSIRIAYFLWFLGPDEAHFKEGTGALLLFSSIMTMLLAVSGLLGEVLSGLRNLIDDIRYRNMSTELEKNISPCGFDIISVKNIPNKV